jgi:hypothetical protein
LSLDSHGFLIFFNQLFASTTALPADVIESLAGGNEKLLRKAICASKKKTSYDAEPSDESDTSGLSSDSNIESHHGAAVAPIASIAPVVIIDSKPTTIDSVFDLSISTVEVEVPTTNVSKQVPLTLTSMLGSDHVNLAIDSIVAQLPVDSNVCLMNSFFFTHFERPDQYGSIIVRWFRKLNNSDPFNTRALLIPVHAE